MKKITLEDARKHALGLGVLEIFDHHIAKAGAQGCVIFENTLDRTRPHKMLIYGPGTPHATQKIAVDYAWQPPNFNAIAFYEEPTVKPKVKRG